MYNYTTDVQTTLSLHTPSCPNLKSRSCFFKEHIEYFFKLATLSKTSIQANILLPGSTVCFPSSLVFLCVSCNLQLAVCTLLLSSSGVFLSSLFHRPPVFLEIVPRDVTPKIVFSGWISPPSSSKCDLFECKLFTWTLDMRDVCGAKQSSTCSNTHTLTLIHTHTLTIFF